MKPKIALAILMLGCTFSMEKLFGFDVAVYVPSLASSFRLHQVLDRHCSGTRFYVFSKSSDYFGALKKGNPNHVISLDHKTLVASDYVHKVWPSFLQASHQKLLLVRKASSNERPKNIGMTNFIGRSQTTEFAKSIIGQDVRVLLATKVEDLLPLLQFGRVDTVFLTRAHFDALEKRTNIELSVTITEASMALPVIASKSGVDSSQVLSCLKQLGQQGVAYFGDITW